MALLGMSTEAILGPRGVGRGLVEGIRNLLDARERRIEADLRTRGQIRQERMRDMRADEAAQSRMRQSMTDRLMELERQRARAADRYDPQTESVLSRQIAEMQAQMAPQEAAPEAAMPQPESQPVDLGMSDVMARMQDQLRPRPVAPVATTAVARPAAMPQTTPGSGTIDAPMPAPVPEPPLPDQDRLDNRAAALEQRRQGELQRARQALEATGHPRMNEVWQRYNQLANGQGAFAEMSPSERIRRSREFLTRALASMRGE